MNHNSQLITPEMLGAYLEGNLDAGQAAIVEAALAVDPDLKDFVEDIDEIDYLSETVFADASVEELGIDIDSIAIPEIEVPQPVAVDFNSNDHLDSADNYDDYISDPLNPNEPYDPNDQPDIYGMLPQDDSDDIFAPDDLNIDSPGHDDFGLDDPTLLPGL